MKTLVQRVVCLLPALVAAFTPLSHAQTANPSAGFDYQEVISGKRLPITLRAKDLTSDYRRIRFFMPDNFRFGTSDFFTKGESVTAGGISYLLAYRREIDRTTNDGHGMAPMRTKLRPADKLLLSLLDGKSVYGGSITDIRPFDPEQDFESEADRNALVETTLRQLWQGIRQWKHNRGQERLPQWGNRVTPALRQTAYPMVHDRRLWEHPSTEEAFGLNPALSNRPLLEVTNRRDLYMVYEFTPAANGTRAVLFADGRVERVDAQRWAQLQKVAVQMRDKDKAKESAKANAGTSQRTNRTTQPGARANTPRR